MKKIFVLAVAVTALITSCGTQKQASSSALRSNSGEALSGDPCVALANEDPIHRKQAEGSGFRREMAYQNALNKVRMEFSGSIAYGICKATAELIGQDQADSELSDMLTTVVVGGMRIIKSVELVNEIGLYECSICAECTDEVLITCIEETLKEQGSEAQKTLLAIRHDEFIQQILAAMTAQ